MTATSASAVELRDMDLITAQSGSIEVNHDAKRRAINELAYKGKRYVYETSISYVNYEEVGSALVQNILMRTRDELVKLRKSGAMDAQDNPAYSDFYMIEIPIASTDRFKYVVVYNPNGVRPADSVDLDFYNLRRTLRMQNFDAGDLTKAMSESFADFTYFTTEQNKLLKSYSQDKLNSYSKMNRIAHLKEFIAEFDEAAAKRKAELEHKRKEGLYYIQNGYVMPRVP